MSGPGMLCWDKGRITAVTPSKPYFFHVSLGEFLVGLSFPFTLVILMRKAFVKVRVALI